VARRIDLVEAKNDERHRKIAARIRIDPSVIASAGALLDKWLAQDAHPALVEWKAALTMLDPDELAKFLESPTPRARRMRISSPFVGLYPSGEGR
jgi:hypothetical protein